MIADGVSTANIGRGKIVSSKIQEIIDETADKFCKLGEYFDYEDSKILKEVYNES